VACEVAPAQDTRSERRARGASSTSILADRENGARARSVRAGSKKDSDGKVIDRRTGKERGAED